MTAMLPPPTCTQTLSGETVCAIGVPGTDPTDGLRYVDTIVDLVGSVVLVVVLLAVLVLLGLGLAAQVQERRKRAAPPDPNE